MPVRLMAAKRLRLEVFPDVESVSETATEEARFHQREFF